MFELNQRNIHYIESELSDLKVQLRDHELYQSIRSIDDIRLFMEYHVFAVWDFMSILKSLQNSLTTTNVPWYPSDYQKARRFINEIVLAEESDFDFQGNTKSHFEMYLDSMHEIGADTTIIYSLIEDLKRGASIGSILQSTYLEKSVKEFLDFTFEIIKTSKSHLIASIFTFGREDLIPEMFLEIINKSAINSNDYAALRYYFERHIELDGDDHGPLSLEMIAVLCENDGNKWEQVLKVAKKAMQHRIKLWDKIHEQILARI